MSNVTNLRQFRKAKTRREKRAGADANAVKFGRNKAQKAVEEFEAARAKAALDGAKREGDEDDET